MRNPNDKCVRCAHIRRLHAGPYGGCVNHLLTESRCGCEVFIDPKATEADLLPNGLTLAEQELFLVIAEEASEVTKAALKIMRFGLDTEHRGVSNRHRLETELGHLNLANYLLEENDTLLIGCRINGLMSKGATIWPYLKHSQSGDYPVTLELLKTLLGDIDTIREEVHEAVSKASEEKGSKPN